MILVEGQDRLLGTFAPRLGANAERRLARMGVEVLLSAQVSEVAAEAVTFTDGATIATDTVVWAAGVRPHPLVEQLGLETTRGGRVVVDQHLRLPDRPEVHVIGDLAASPLEPGSDRTSGPPGGPVQLAPQVAPGAIQGGQHAAAVIAAQYRAGAERPRPFAYRDKGSMATIGRNAAVVELPVGPKITGFPGWVAWLGLHLVMLIGFRNRANVLVNWAWNYLTYDRGSRLIVELDDGRGRQR